MLATVVTITHDNPHRHTNPESANKTAAAHAGAVIEALRERGLQVRSVTVMCCCQVGVSDDARTRVFLRVQPSSLSVDHATINTHTVYLISKSTPTADT